MPWNGNEKQMIILIVESMENLKIAKDTTYQWTEEVLHINTI